MNFSDYDFYLTQNGASKHITPIEKERPRMAQKKWNENNEGYGLKLQKQENNLVTSYLLGQYKNSLGDNTNYIGAQWQKRFGDNKLHMDLGILTGLATGYNLPVTPMVLPTATFGTDTFDFNVRYAPHIEGVTPEVFMFNMDYALK